MSRRLDESDLDAYGRAGLQAIRTLQREHSDTPSYTANACVHVDVIVKAALGVVLQGWAIAFIGDGHHVVLCATIADVERAFIEGIFGEPGGDELQALLADFQDPDAWQQGTIWNTLFEDGAVHAIRLQPPA